MAPKSSSGIRRVAISVPQMGVVGAWPLIIAIVLAGLELAIAFLDIILQASSSGGAESEALSRLLSRGLLSPIVINWHMTWCIPFSFTLSFVENTLRWTLNRRKCNFFGSINALVAAVFLIAILYSWLWANNGELMLQFCKYFLIPFGLKMGQEQLREYIYTDQVKYIFDVLVCWGYPLQCVVVLVDAILCMCRRGRERVMYLLVRKDASDRISAKVDPRLL